MSSALTTTVLPYGNDAAPLLPATLVTSGRGTAKYLRTCVRGDVIGFFYVWVGGLGMGAGSSLSFLMCGLADSPLTLADGCVDVCGAQWPRHAIKSFNELTW